MGWTLVALIVGAGVGATATHLSWRRRTAAAEQQEASAAARVARQRMAALEQAQRELTAALDVLPAGVVLVDAEGGLLARNRQAEHFLGITCLDALVGPKPSSRTSEGAGPGTSGWTPWRSHGPPRRTLVVRGSVVSVGGRQVGAMSIIEDASERVRLDSVRIGPCRHISHELKTPVGAIALLAGDLGRRGRAGGHRPPRLQADRRGPTACPASSTSLLSCPASSSGARRVSEVVDLACRRPGGPRRARRWPPPGASQVQLEASRGANVIGNRRQLLSAVGQPRRERRPALRSGCRRGRRRARRRRPGRAGRARPRHGHPRPGTSSAIFERFYRVDEARAARPVAASLGLSIVRHVRWPTTADMVSVDVGRGRGSTFTLRVPLAGTAAGSPRHRAGGVT